MPIAEEGESARDTLYGFIKNGYVTFCRIKKAKWSLMKVSLLIKNFWGTPLPISATLGGGISPSSLDLQRFAVVALKKHTHHRTIISSFLLSYLNQDLFSLLRPSAHKYFQKNKQLRGWFFKNSIFYNPLITIRIDSDKISICLFACSWPATPPAFHYNILYIL